MVNVWWLAIDRSKGYASFEELKRRKVIAQGWPDLGDMTRFLDENANTEPGTVVTKLTERLRANYPDDIPQQQLPANLYNFFFGIKSGDLVVGIEGMNVRGICEIPEACSYCYEPKTHEGKEQNYAHGRGPVRWIPWEIFSPDWAPAAPGQLLAVRGLQAEREEVIERFQGEEWQETMHLLSSPKNAQRLRRSIRHVERGDEMPTPMEGEAIG
jgi:predicted Mrr-cat superfamily restriction endonuclease